VHRKHLKEKRKFDSNVQDQMQINIIKGKDLNQLLLVVVMERNRIYI